MSETKDTGFVAVHHFSDLYHGHHVRIFSSAIHGTKYKDVAREFAKTQTPVSQAHQVKVSIEACTEKDAKAFEAENAEKENARMMEIYRSKGWVDKKGNVRAPRILVPEDFDI